MSKYDTLHIYARPGVRERLKRLARLHKRSLSSEVQYLIDQAYKEEIEHETSSEPSGKYRHLF